jgi:hypothetical protein
LANFLALALNTRWEAVMFIKHAPEKVIGGRDHAAKIFLRQQRLQKQENKTPLPEYFVSMPA